MKAQGTAMNIHFDPLLPEAWMIGLLIAVLMVTVLAAWKNRRGMGLRLLALAALLLALANPSLLEEQRKPVSDVAVIVVDQSPSQKMGRRAERTQAALAALKHELASRKDMELRVIEAPEMADGPAPETRLFGALERTLADVPPRRRAGVILLTDGQVHDVPKNLENATQFGPVHVLLSGEKNEKDRQVVITQAPTYGLVGQTVTVRYRVEDTANIGHDTATVTIDTHDGTPDMKIVPVNTDLTADLPVSHAGQNVFEISAGAVEGEITESNNRSAMLVNGVRDRLRVLLVSGQPHAGGRMWRDLLTSDPGVDLVHFTILRDPEKLDATPQNELSLIAFPFRELFEIKLYDFDLIIFDRYQLNRILPDNYFKNIATYVEKGGALLEASGPSYAGQDSLYYTALMSVLPGAPTGQVLKKPFLPAVTRDGAAHPVTRNLLWKTAAGGGPGWGEWLRQVVIHPESGDVLMKGIDDNPLLVLDRVGAGRVAQIASDQIWLWARGYEGGGPYAELLRRVVHWLMKEPELDEEALDVKVSASTIRLSSQNFHNQNASIAVTKPDGSRQTAILEPDAGGLFSKSLQADQLGIYSFENAAGQKSFAVIGDLNPPELRGVKTTPDILRPLADASGGGVYWLADTAPAPSVHYAAGSGSFAGRGWIGLRRNNDYTVTSVHSRPLLPPWLAALAILGLVLAGWRREGQAC